MRMLGGDNNWRLVFWVQLGNDIVRTYVVHQHDFVEIFPDPILLASNNVKG